jgi:HAMP domain-containing protein
MESSKKADEDLQRATKELEDVRASFADTDGEKEGLEDAHRQEVGKLKTDLNELRADLEAKHAQELEDTRVSL